MTKPTFMDQEPSAGPRPFLHLPPSLAVGQRHTLQMGENPRAQLISHVRLFATPWTVAHQAPLSTGLSRQEYCSGLPFPSPGDLPDPGIKPEPTASPALEGGFFTTVLPGKPQRTHRPIRSHIHEAKSQGLCGQVDFDSNPSCFFTTKSPFLHMGLSYTIYRKKSNWNWNIYVIICLNIVFSYLIE